MIVLAPSCGGDDAPPGDADLGMSPDTGAPLPDMATPPPPDMDTPPPPDMDTPPPDMATPPPPDMDTPPPPDMSMPPPTMDGGAACAPGTVRVANACPGFRACGGELSGRYCYADLCVTHDEIFPGVAGCTTAMVAFREFRGSVRGEVSFEGARVRRDAEVAINGTLQFPAGVCTVMGCDAIQRALQIRFPSATCRTDSTGCTCDVAYTSSTRATEGYTTMGNTLRTESGRVYDYCVAEGLRARDRTPSGAEPGIQSFSRP
jgi:hypothetical protein